MFKNRPGIFTKRSKSSLAKASRIVRLLACISLLLLSGCGVGGGSEPSGLVSPGTNPGGSGPGKATVSWDAPTTHADGTDLTDLAGYKVYYGTASRNYNLGSVSLPIGSDRLTCANKGDNNDGITDRIECAVIFGTAEGLGSGTYYYFAATHTIPQTMKAYILMRLVRQYNSQERDTL